MAASTGIETRSPEGRNARQQPGQSPSCASIGYLRTFAFSNGARYRDLEPDADLVTPNKNPQLMSYEGWAFAARTPERDFFLVFLEKGAPQARVRGAVPDAQYQAQWFNPRNGEWSNVGSGVVTAAATGWIDLPAQPTPEDWGLRLLLKK